MSIADGVSLAIDRACQVNATALQIFTRNQVQWEAPPLEPETACEFRNRFTESGIRFLCAHSSYLINLASPDDTTRERSLTALVEELTRADALGCACLVMHPGSPKDDPRETGISRVVSGILAAFDQTRDLRVKLAIEDTAGQGNVFGSNIAEIADILHRAGDHPRLAMCLDTCHAFAAGYDLCDASVVADLASAIDDSIGLDRLLVLHLNDSLGACGSRRDRHAHIGKGQVGETGFRNILHEPRFAAIPGIIETPKNTKTLAEDVTNLSRLRRLQRERRGAEATAS